MNLLELFKKKKNLFDYIKNKKLIIVDNAPQVFDSGEIENDWGLGFENDCNLTIYNNRIIRNADSLSDFIGEKVSTIDYTDTSVSFNFTNNKKIIVSLLDQDWNGPEVMQLNYKGQIIIWN
jgi:hypothetical protein